MYQQPADRLKSSATLSSWHPASVPGNPARSSGAGRATRFTDRRSMFERSALDATRAACPPLTQSLRRNALRATCRSGLLATWCMPHIRITASQLVPELWAWKGAYQDLQLSDPGES